MNCETIIHSPNSPMPEPYTTYIEQRAQKIADTLAPHMGERCLQLCPRAITAEEKVRTDSEIYGCIVRNANDGLKTILYEPTDQANAAVIYSREEAAQYATRLFQNEQSVRVKDPRESDGDGQTTVSTFEELYAALDDYSEIPDCGLVLMPNFATITDRYTTGMINLGQDIGKFEYIGRELTVCHDSREVFGGGDIAVFLHNDQQAAHEASVSLDIPLSILAMSRRAVATAAAKMEHAGRLSVDTISGTLDNGEVRSDVVDFTPRVGGHTPAETLAIAALKTSRARLALAGGRLVYNPTSDIVGEKFVDTPTLCIAAQVYEVRK